MNLNMPKEQDENDEKNKDNNSTEIDEEHIMQIIEQFQRQKGLVQHQIESFNYYINNGIQNVISGEADISVSHKPGQIYSVTFDNVFISFPKIMNNDRKLTLFYPKEARNRDMNYDSAICCDIVETLTEDEKIISKNVHRRIMIAKTPIMLRSSRCNLTKISSSERIPLGECEFDEGGYFIIKGNERVLVAQLRGNYNQVIVLKQKSNVKFSYIAEIRSMSEETGHSALVQAMISIDDRSILLSIPHIKELIPVGIIFKALGFFEEDIYNLIGFETKFNTFIYRSSYFIKTQEEALIYIGKHSMHIIPKDKRVSYAKQVVMTELFPHLGITASVKEKAMFIGFMIKRLFLTRLGIRSVDDRDNYASKRIETAGVLCTELFRTLYKRYINTIKQQLEKKKSCADIITIVNKLNSITTGLQKSFATGNWGVQKNSYIRAGVSQVLSRLSPGATKSHLRRIVIPVGKEGKNVKIRLIHSSQIFYICPCETPESQTVGIVLNFAFLARVTKEIPTVLVKEIVEKNKHVMRVNKIKLKDIKKLTYVFLNGILIGLTDTPLELIDELKKKRNSKRLDPDVSVTYDVVDDQVNIFCDSGRASRPVFTVGKDGLNIKKEHGTDWDKLLTKDLIRYVDNSEVEQSVIAMTPKDIPRYKNDFCEIHPSMMLGVMASTIPFQEHTQSPRLCYPSSMGKQALGMYALSYQTRTDTMAYVLDYPQRPLVNTRIARIMGFDTLATGLNAIVAILAYSGYNQEDSIIMNQSSIDRGMFRVTSYRTITDFEKKGDMYTYETIGVPPQSSNKNIQPGELGYFKRKTGNYSLLDERGIVRQGINIKKGDIVIGKWLTKGSKSGTETLTDCSVFAKSGEDGIVDRIVFTNTKGGHRLVKIIVRKCRIPEMGDKFATRESQKGTVGITYRQEDMPFNIEGICPDIILNPHAIPSRMTVNQLMECVLGKACAIGGTYGDATCFTSNSTNASQKICELLKKVGMQEMQGYEQHGWETLYSGFTGEPLKARIFMGPTYYQRLKHLVSAKIHSRSEGHVTTLTRQPSEGRSREGGLRFGEMERDCMIGHGTSAFLKERLFNMSDPFTVIVCDHCGMITSSQTECKGCQKDNVSTVNIPYAMKLLKSEVEAMGIKMVIKTKK